MLVLSRKEGEEVLIGNYIAVSIVAVQGKRVKLGFTAPNDVMIRRAELVGAVDEPSCPVDKTESMRSKPR